MLKKESKGEKFFCCIPLKVGIWFIEFFVFFLTINYSFVAVLLFFNEYHPPYYPAVLLISLIPIYFAFCIFYVFVNSTTKTGRWRLFIATVMAAVTVLLWIIWQITYITVLYDEEVLYTGMGDKEARGNYGR